jgi:prolipoprotein diacylglyceryltransferase
MGLFLKMGQLLSIPFILLGFWMIFRAYKRGEQHPATVQPTPPSQPASKAEKMAARRAKRENREK